MAERQSGSSGTRGALIGAGIAAAGAAAFLLARRSPDMRDDGVDVSDAPDHVFRRKTGRYEEGLVGRTVTINRPRDELFREWRNFSRFPLFMENVREVQELGDGRSRWRLHL